MKQYIISKINEYKYKKTIDKFKNGSYKNAIVDIKLSGGLCNKLYCLMSAVELGITNKIQIAEPYFGWRQPILFSDIFDIDYFNQYMYEQFNCQNLLVSRSIAEKSNKLVSSAVDLWKLSEVNVSKERIDKIVDLHSYKIHLLKALKLNHKYCTIVDTYVKKNEDYLACQIRIESDWQEYAKVKMVGENEKLLVDLDSLIDMLLVFTDKRTIFFTTGENQDNVKASLENEGFNAYYYYNPDLEYEINAAINFDICVKAKSFIGNSRSSYSNLISLKRSVLDGKVDSFIYNYGDKIEKRNDFGIYPEGKVAISKDSIKIK